MKIIKKKLPTIIFLISFCYYTILSAKDYTWLFASGDSGDWLAASSMWIVPQPFGSPLYISLGHLVNIIPDSLVINMTILLSALPAAITIAIIYLIVKKLTNKYHLAIISSITLLGSSIFLSQATVLEEYSLAVMFVVLGFYYYIQGKWKLTLFSLGLGSAVHIMVVPITALWLMVHFREWRTLVKKIPVYIIFGALPYILIFYLMASDAPRLVAGGLSLGAIDSYLGSTGVVGTISIVESPNRMLHVIMFLISSLGLAIIPSVIGFKKPWDNKTRVMLATIGFSVWYYLTCMDPTTWTFLIYSMPFFVIAASIGLSKLKNYHAIIVVISSIVLIITNGIMLNADKLTKENPIALKYYEAIQQIPNGSAVIINRGGWEALGLYYAMSQGKDVIPIFLIYANNEDDELHEFYVEWVQDTYNIEGYNAQTMTKYVLDKDIDTYILLPLLTSWESVFEYDIFVHRFGKVKSVSLDKIVNDENEQEVTRWNPFIKD